MPEYLSLESMIPPKAGDVCSASLMRSIIAALRRRIFGPGVRQTSEGWLILGGLTRGSVGHMYAVMRTLVTTPSSESCTMQEVGYNEDDKLTGEADFHKHVVAHGAIFDVYPPPTATWDMFVAEGALRLVGEAEDPENLSSAILWLVDRDTHWARMWIKTSENMTVVIANGS